MGRRSKKSKQQKTVLKRRASINTKPSQTHSAASLPSPIQQTKEEDSYSEHFIFLSNVFFWLFGFLALLVSSQGAGTAFISTFLLLNDPANLCASWACAQDYVSAGVYFILFLLSSWLLFFQLPQYFNKHKNSDPMERLTAALMLFLQTIAITIYRFIIFQSFIRIYIIDTISRVNDLAYYIVLVISILQSLLIILQYVIKFIKSRSPDSSFKEFTESIRRRTIIIEKINVLPEEEIIELERLLYKTQKWSMFSLKNLLIISFGSIVVALIYAVFEEFITRL